MCYLGNPTGFDPVLIWGFSIMSPSEAILLQSCLLVAKVLYLTANLQYQFYFILFYFILFNGGWKMSFDLRANLQYQFYFILFYFILFYFIQCYKRMTNERCHLIHLLLFVVIVNEIFHWDDEPILKYIAIRIKAYKEFSWCLSCR